jgi:hypothetical protein
MLNQRHRDLIGSVVCIVLGILFCIGSTNYGDIRSKVPSAGFLPFIGGIILIFLSLINLLWTTIKKGKQNIETFFPERHSLKKLFLLIFALFTYGLALIPLGFLLTTMLFVIFLMKFIEPQKWVTTLITSFLLSLLSYILFEILLKVQLPYGILDLIKFYDSL